MSRLVSKGEQFLTQLTDALNDEKARREKDAVSLQRLQAEVGRLRKIETTVGFYLDAVEANGDWGQHHDSLSVMLGRTPKTPPAPLDDPWDRKPGRRYVANGYLFCAEKGGIVEVVAQNRPDSYSVRNLSTGCVFHGVGLDQDSWRLPTAEENAPKPAGTLVTDFDSLKAGDVVLRETDDGPVKAEIVMTNEPGMIRDLHRTCVLEGEKTRNAVFRDDVEKGLVRLLSSAKRKPYVKDGRWVAEVGDRFRPNFKPVILKGDVTVDKQRGGTYSEYLLTDEFGNIGLYELSAGSWEPVS